MALQWLVSGSIGLALAEWAANIVIDELKVSGKTSFARDQALHVIGKASQLSVLFC